MAKFVAAIAPPDRRSLREYRRGGPGRAGFRRPNLAAPISTIRDSPRLEQVDTRRLRLGLLHFRQ